MKLKFIPSQIFGNRSVRWTSPNSSYLDNLKKKLVGKKFHVSFWWLITLKRKYEFLRSYLTNPHTKAVDGSQKFLSLLKTSDYSSDVQRRILPSSHQLLGWLPTLEDHFLSEKSSLWTYVARENIGRRSMFFESICILQDINRQSSWRLQMEASLVPDGHINLQHSDCLVKYGQVDGIMVKFDAHQSPRMRILGSVLTRIYYWFSGLSIIKTSHDFSLLIHGADLYLASNHVSFLNRNIVPRITRDEPMNRLIRNFQKFLMYWTYRIVAERNSQIHSWRVKLCIKVIQTVAFDVSNFI